MWHNSHFDSNRNCFSYLAIESWCWKFDIALATGQFACHFVGLLLGRGSADEHWKRRSDKQKSKWWRQSLTYHTLQLRGCQQIPPQYFILYVFYFCYIYNIYMYVFSPIVAWLFEAFRWSLALALVLGHFIVIQLCC